MFFYDLHNHHSFSITKTRTIIGERNVYGNRIRCVYLPTLRENWPHFEDHNCHATLQSFVCIDTSFSLRIRYASAINNQRHG